MHKLPPSTRRALDASLDNWRGKRPIWLLLLLNSLRSTLATAENSRTPVLDLYLARKAQVWFRCIELKTYFNTQELHKKVSAVELPYEQCKPLNDLDDHYVSCCLTEIKSLLKKNNFKCSGIIRSRSAATTGGDSTCAHAQQWSIVSL